VRVDIIFEPSDKGSSFLCFCVCFARGFFCHVYEVFDKICVS
jgi:hypothetical protein